MKAKKPWLLDQEPRLLIASISFHLKQVVKVAEIGIYPCSLDLLFPFAPLGLEGFAYVVPYRQKGASWCGVFKSSFGASLVSIAGGAERDSI